MRIGQLATRAGTSTKTIRYYEDLGLLPRAARTDNGYRNFEDETVERLSFIHDAQASGLSLSEIRTILGMRDAGESTCEHVARLLEGHMADIDRKITQLMETRIALAELTSRARQLDPANCTNPHRCQTIARADG